MHFIRIKNFHSLQIPPRIPVSRTYKGILKLTIKIYLKKKTYDGQEREADLHKQRHPPDTKANGTEETKVAAAGEKRVKATGDTVGDTARHLPAQLGDKGRQGHTPTRLREPERHLSLQN